MIAIKSLLSNLNRDDVAEVVLQSGKPPAMRVEGNLQVVSEQPVSADDLMQMLFSAGGSRYVDSLGGKPTQWRTRVEGVGMVMVSATAHGDVIEARFMLREPSAARSPTMQPQRAETPAPLANRRRRESYPEEPGESTSTGESSLDSLDMPTPPRNPRINSPLPPVQRPTVPRGRLHTLPSENEVDLNIRPSLIPSVPPDALEEAAGPVSPRTLPEARFSRDPELLKSAPSQTPQVGLAVVAPREVVAPSPPLRRGAPTGAISELNEPFAMSMRKPEPPPPSAPVSVPAPSSKPSSMPTDRPLRGSPARTTRPFVRDAHTTLFRTLLRQARDLGASDLHIVAGRPPLLRIAGQIVCEGPVIEPRVAEDMIHARVPERLVETLDRDGSCDFSYQDPELGRMRVNASRQRTGMKASLRIIADKVPTLGALGLPEAIAHATEHHQGLIVVAGPTGHGKTTTLAAIVDIINRTARHHVITVEDPVEYLHERKMALLSQREVGTHTRSFASALKASLREDPDVIVVGELRDTETVRMALSASETGHLVLGTMNTPSAAKTIDRLIDLFPPADQQQVRITLAGGLRLIVSQRLVPHIEGKRMVAAVELLPGMVPLWNLIRDNRTYQIPSLQQRGKALGVVRLDDSLADLVRAGTVSAAAAITVAEAPDELESVLGMKRTGPVAAPRTTATPPGRGFFDRMLSGKKGGS